MATSRSDADADRGYTEFNVPYRIAYDLLDERSGQPSQAEIAAIALALWHLLPPAGTKDSSGGSWARVAAFESVSQRL